MRTAPPIRGLGELSSAFLGEAVSWWRILQFGALALVTALSPAAYDRATLVVTARQIYFSAWQILAGFTLAAAILSVVLIRIVIQTAQELGLSVYALELIVRVLVVDLLPLFAALFVALRSGAAINTEVALFHIHGDLEALVRSGGDPLRHELVPRVIGSVVAVGVLTCVTGTLALALAYFELYGLSPWGIPQFTRVTGEVFEPVLVAGLALKTLLFGASVAVIPISAALASPRVLRFAPVAVLRGMVRLIIALALIEGAFLLLLYA
jgi:phospholipid/cholesterol/gamma-HCH transport system permease protein